MALAGLRPLTNLLRIHNLGKLSRSTLRCKYTAMSERRPDEMLDEIFETVRGQRFERIVVLQTKYDSDPRYYIVADAFNRRHLSHGTEMINKLYKQQIKSNDEQFARVSEAENWNVLDFQSVVVHLFLGDTREKFDLEQLWAVGSEYDELSNPLPQLEEEVAPDGETDELAEDSKDRL